MSNADIIQRIKQIRAETGLSQSKFAQKLGVSSGNVSSWELGTALPGATALIAIRKTFGYSIDWILTGQNPTHILGQNSAFDPVLKEMTDVLKQLLNDENRDMRSWTKVQFQKAFEEYYPVKMNQK